VPCASYRYLPSHALRREGGATGYSEDGTENITHSGRPPELSGHRRSAVLVFDLFYNPRVEIVDERGPLESPVVTLAHPATQVGRSSRPVTHQTIGVPTANPPALTATTRILRVHRVRHDTRDCDNRSQHGCYAGNLSSSRSQRIGTNGAIDSASGTITRSANCGRLCPSARPSKLFGPALGSVQGARLSGGQ